VGKKGEGSQLLSKRKKVSTKRSVGRRKGGGRGVVSAMWGWSSKEKDRSVGVQGVSQHPMKPEKVERKARSTTGMGYKEKRETA